MQSSHHAVAHLIARCDSSSPRQLFNRTFIGLSNRSTCLHGKDESVVDRHHVGSAPTQHPRSRCMMREYTCRVVILVGPGTN
jgi:hypothetical protein